MNLNSEALQCGICYMQYDRQQRAPVSLPQCGHTCCKVCIQHIIQSKQEGLLDDKSTSETCSEHNTAYSYLCEDDHEYACSDCCIFGKHNGHKILRLGLTKEEHSNKIRNWENEKREFNDSLSKTRFLLEKRQYEILEALEVFYDDIDVQIKKRRQLDKSLITSIFAEEKKIFSDESFRNQEVKQSLEQKIVKYKTPSPTNLCEIAKEDSKHSEELDPKKVITSIQTYRSSISELQNLISFNMEAFKPTNLKLLPHTLLHPTLDIPDSLETSCLSCETVENELMIKINKTAQVSNYKDIFSQQDTKMISLYIEAAHVSIEDLRFLSDLLFRFRRIESMQINFGIDVTSHNQEKLIELAKDGPRTLTVTS